MEKKYNYMKMKTMMKIFFKWMTMKMKKIKKINKNKKIKK